VSGDRSERQTSGDRYGGVPVHVGAVPKLARAIISPAIGRVTRRHSACVTSARIRAAKVRPPETGAGWLPQQYAALPVVTPQV